MTDRNLSRGGGTPSLFGEPVWPGHEMLRTPARNTDPDTSHAAAAVVKTPGAKSLAARVLRALRARPYADFQLAILLGLREEQVRKRRADLCFCHPARVQDSGVRVTNPATGMKQTVWEVVP